MATAPNPKYDLQTAYNKYQACEDKPAAEGCSCCPPGLVGVYDDCGKHIGCVTPNDAEHLESSMITCTEGFVKLMHPTTGDFLGCVSEANFATLYAALVTP